MESSARWNIVASRKLVLSVAADGWLCDAEPSQQEEGEESKPVCSVPLSECAGGAAGAGLSQRPVVLQLGLRWMQNVTCTVLWKGAVALCTAVAVLYGLGFLTFFAISKAFLQNCLISPLFKTGVKTFQWCYSSNMRSHTACYSAFAAVSIHVHHIFRGILIAGCFKALLR